MQISPQIPRKYTSILICGFMGAGKSWFMKRMKRSAPRGFLFTDLDQMILKKSGYNTILKMMKALGEDHFRRIENEILIEHMKKGNHVISLGGGALNKGINYVLDKRSDILVIWIDTPLDQCLANLEKDHKNVRPLAKQEPGEVSKLYDQRKEVYSVADVRISWDELQNITNFLDVCEIVGAQIPVE